MTQNQDQPHARPIPSGPSFGRDLNGDYVAGDQHKGDRIEGDKVTGGQVKADTIEGGVTQTNTVNQNTTYQQAVKELFDEMAKVAPELTQKEIEALVPAVEIQPEGTAEPKTLDTEDFEALDDVEFTAGEDHPAVVFAAVQRYSESGPTPTEQEQKSLFQRAYSCVMKYATTKEAIAAGKIALAGMKGLASTSPPFNVLVPIVETAIGLASDE